MFKIKHEGPHHLILHHLDGHEVKIAKQALSKGMMEKFKSMPKVEGFAEGTPDGPIPEPDPTRGVASDSGFDPLLPIKNAVGGYLNNPVLQGVKAIAGKAKDAIAGEFHPSQDASVKPVSVQEGGKPELMNASAFLPAATTEKTAVPGYDPTEGKQSAVQMLQSAANQQTAALGQEAKAIGEKGAAESKVYQQQADFNQQLMTDYQTQRAQLDKEHASIAKDYMDGHIDPHKLWNDKSIPSKVSTAIGLILGGIGGGLTGQGNMALQFLNHQIDRDIDSQKEELGKKKTLLEENFKKTGDLRTATEMTRLQYASLIQAQLGKAAADSASPIAQAQAAKAAGEIKAALAPKQAELAQQLALTKILNNPALKQEENASHAIRLSVLSGRLPKELQDNAYKDLTALQKMKKSGTNILDSFDKVSHMSTAAMLAGAHKSEVEPVLAQLVKDAEGRITPQDTKMIEVLFPEKSDPLKAASVGLSTEQFRARKRQKLATFVTEKMGSSLLDAYGIPKPVLSTVAGRPIGSGPNFQRTSMKK